MSVLNGQLANQTTFNNAFVSRTAVATSAVGVVTLSNTTQATDPFTGGLILGGGLGIAKNVYIGGLLRVVDATESTDEDTGSVTTLGGMGVKKNLNVGGDVLANNLSGVNSGDVSFDNVGSVPNTKGASVVDQVVTLQPADSANPGLVSAAAQTIGGDKTFQDNVIINGDLTVQGTTTTINSTDLEVVDQNITVNKDGDDASAEGAGLEVVRTGTRGSIKYINALASKWKIGALGSESEVITANTVQAITGEKSFTANLNVQAKFVGDIVDDTTTTGANATFPAPAKTTVRLTDGALTSIDMISSPLNSQLFVAINRTGNDININNLTGGTSANQIITGTGATLTWADDSALWFFRDGTSGKWQIVGGSGAGGAGSYTPPLMTTYTVGGSSTTHNFTGSPLYVKVKMAGGGGGGTGSGAGFTQGSGGTDSGLASGSLLLASGGQGGSGNDGGAGGATFIDPSIQGYGFNGGNGGQGLPNNSPGNFYGGYGGNNAFGGASQASAVVGHGNDGATNTGAGGGGAEGPTTVQSGPAGGAGGYIEAIISGAALAALAGSVLVDVGAGGAKGLAGTAGFNGGNGADGIVILEEHYQ